MTLNELEEYFKTATLPKELWLNKATHITNVRAMVDSHIEVLKVNEGRPAFGAFYDRLRQVKKAIDSIGEKVRS